MSSSPGKNETKRRILGRIKRERKVLSWRSATLRKVQSFSASPPSLSPPKVFRFLAGQAGRTMARHVHPDSFSCLRPRLIWLEKFCFCCRHPGTFSSGTRCHIRCQLTLPGRVFCQVPSVLYNHPPSSITRAPSLRFSLPPMLLPLFTVIIVAITIALAVVLTVVASAALVPRCRPAIQPTHTPLQRFPPEGWKGWLIPNSGPGTTG